MAQVPPSSPKRDSLGNVYLGVDLIRWIEQKVREGVFRNQSHAVEWALRDLKKKLDEASI